MSNGQAQQIGWSARLLIGLLLVIVGAGASIWTLGHYPSAARLLGVQTVAPLASPHPIATNMPQQPAQLAPGSASPAAEDARVASIESRLDKIENATQHAVGSAGRADALVIAFAARRAIDRGVALGYLEPLLVQRFGAQQQAAVATIITASRNPVRLGDLIADYRELGPALRRGGADESWWTGLRRELGSLVEIRSSARPSPSPDARYQRAVEQLQVGNVDSALAETMRMPGSAQARGWIDRARRYVATQNALDQLESAALLGNDASGG